MYARIKEYRKTNSTEFHTSQRGRKRKITFDDEELIKKLIEENNDITIREINETLGLGVSDETIRRRVIKFGYRYKKKSVYAAERDRSRCGSKRNEWLENIGSYDSDKLVFLDESGVNIDMTRHYGRTVGKARAVDKTPENTPRNTTILSSVKLNGSTAYTTYSSGTTGDIFVDYLENVLIPTLEKGDIVIMDNMRSHHVKSIIVSQNTVK